MSFRSTLSYPHKEFLNPCPLPPRSKFNPHPPRTQISAGSRTRPANAGTRNPRGCRTPTRMRPGQIWVRQTQNPTVTSAWRRMLMRSTWLFLGLEHPRSVVLNILPKGSQTQTYGFVRAALKIFNMSKKFLTKVKLTKLTRTSSLPFRSYDRSDCARHASHIAVHRRDAGFQFASYRTWELKCYDYHILWYY